MSTQDLASNASSSGSQAARQQPVEALPQEVHVIETQDPRSCL